MGANLCRSSTTKTFVYNGQTYSVNSALAALATADSDGDGIPNNVDPTPILIDQTVNFTEGFTTKPAPAVVLSWYSPAGATNEVDYRTNLVSSSWQVLTNLVQGGSSGTLSIQDPVRAGAPHYYRVVVTPILP